MAEKTKDLKNKLKALEKKVMGDMPHNLEAEQALLGCLLLDTKIQVEISANLKAEDFYAESHKLIFTAMLEIIKNNMPVDLVTLTDKLEKLGCRWNYIYCRAYKRCAIFSKLSKIFINSFKRQFA